MATKNFFPPCGSPGGSNPLSWFIILKGLSSTHRGKLNVCFQGRSGYRRNLYQHATEAPQKLLRSPRMIRNNSLNCKNLVPTSPSLDI